MLDCVVSEQSVAHSAGSLPAGQKPRRVSLGSGAQRKRAVLDAPHAAALRRNAVLDDVDAEQTAADLAGDVETVSTSTYCSGKCVEVRLHDPREDQPSVQLDELFTPTRSDTRLGRERLRRDVRSFGENS